MRHRLGNPLLGALRVGEANHRSHVGPFVAQDRPREFLRCRCKLAGEFIEDAALHEDPLHADAALSGKGKAASHTSLHRMVDVGIRVHDASGVAAQLQRNPLLSGTRLQRPARGGGAGKGEELEALVLDQRRRGFGASWEEC